MSFLKKIWKNRESQYPGRRTLTRVDTQTSIDYDITRAEGTVTEVGDDFSAENMNDLEQRIADAFDDVTFDVDSSLSTASENPVQNKVITTNLNTTNTNVTNALNMIMSTSSDAYSSSKAYSVGDHVIYNNKVYKCITACSRGSWTTNRSCFEQTTLTGAVTDLNSALTANSTPFRFGYDSSSNKYGYIINSGGADTVIPFNSGKIKRIKIGGTSDIPAANQTVTRYVNIPANYQGKVTNDNIFTYMELVDCRNSYVYASVSGTLSGNQVKVTITNGHSVGTGATINWRVDLVIAE